MDAIGPGIIDLNAKSERSVSFLMLGQTGAGKTTLINAFVNHFNKKEYSSQKQILIPQKVGEECSFPELKDKVDEAEFCENNEGKSKTQTFRSYKIENDERSMLILDTPGIGDTRGFKQDQENIKNIVEGINNINEDMFIQAIIFVVGNECRDNTLFRYYVDEIKKIMTKPCLEQTLVVCTKKSGKFPDELKKMVTKSLGIDLPDDRWFTIENTAFIEEIDVEDEDNHLIMEKQWNIGRKIFDKIYTKASQFDKIITKDLDELFKKRRELENTIDQRIQKIAALKQAKEDICAIRKEQHETEQDKKKFIKEESKEKHKFYSRNLNYNCDQCNSTCIENTNRIGYAVKSVLTLSIYHWISKKALCVKCGHTNREHVYENSKRFTGLDELSKQILKEIEKDALEQRKSHLSNEELAQELDKKVEESMEAVARLSVDIEHLGIISVTYDSYLAHLQFEIDCTQNKEQLNELKEQKMKYEKIKEQYKHIKDLQKAAV